MMALDLPARILETVPRPVWVVDGQGAVAFANPAAAVELGYRHPNDLRGRPSHDTLHSHRLDGSAYPAAECPLLRPIRTGKPAAAADQWLFRRDGQPFPVAWSSAPIELPNGPGTVLTFTDITQRREREAGARDQEWADARADSPRRSALRDRATLTATIWEFAAENATDPQLTPGGTGPAASHLAAIPAVAVLRLGPHPGQLHPRSTAHPRENLASAGRNRDSRCAAQRIHQRRDADSRIPAPLWVRAFEIQIVVSGVAAEIPVNRVVSAHRHPRTG